MCRYYILIMAGLISVVILSSCSKPASTEGDAAALHNVFVEDMGNGVCRQVPAGLMWQIKESKLFSTWEEADEYANRLQLGGFDDWRLPTRDECLMLTELLLMKKGTCPIKIRKGNWVSNDNKKKPGLWDDYPLCGGPEFRWIDSDEGFVRAVRP